MTEDNSSPIVPHTRVPEETEAEEEAEDVFTVYETKQDGSTVGIPTTTRVKTE